MPTLFLICNVNCFWNSTPLAFQPWGSLLRWPADTEPRSPGHLRALTAAPSHQDPISRFCAWVVGQMKQQWTSTLQTNIAYILKCWRWYFCDYRHDSDWTNYSCCGVCLHCSASFTWAAFPKPPQDTHLTKSDTALTATCSASSLCRHSCLVSCFLHF